MKKLFSTFILIFLIALGVTFSINVTASTLDVYNVVTCPGENMATEMKINWQSKTSFTEMNVEYTKATDTTFANKKVAKGSFVEFSRKNTSREQYVGFEAPRHVWTADLENLTPETKYIYRIVSGDTVYVDNFAFETASLTDKEFSFLFMTDPQYYNEAGSKRFNAMAERHIKDDDVKFAFLTGDITDRGGNSDLWDLFFDKTSLAKIPYVTTVGNHEYYDKGTTTVDNSIYNHYYNNPKNGPTNILNSAYYMNYNNALFVLIDSEETEHVEEQKKWFVDVCNNNPASYIIVGAHRSPYAGASYYEDGVRFLKVWGDLFDECSVDLVLTGHDHMYARTKNLYNDEICTEKYKGTTYILGGSAGLKYYPQKNHENEPKWDKWFERRTSCTVVTLGEKNIKIKTVNYDGFIEDEATIARKRFGTIDPSYTKEEFEKSFTIKNAMPDTTSGEISWSKKGYGLVKAMEFINLNSGIKLGGQQFINDELNTFKVEKGFWVGELNKIQVNISYADGSKGKVILELDNNIKWGNVTNFRVTELTAKSVTFTWNQEINPEFDYIKRIQIYKNGLKAKNSLLRKDDLLKNEYSITLDRSIEGNTKYEFQIDLLNVNGTPVWSGKVNVVTPEDLEYEERYKNKLGQIAIQAALDNLLKQLEIGK